MKFIYIEEEIKNHPFVERIKKRFPKSTLITCDRYMEVFNPKSQNFRLQKQSPSLILAKKHKNFVLPTPPGYGIGGENNFYFSHMLNCVYDCRYCFLQGMYPSANYVIFINTEDFKQAIEEKIAPNTYFFSGYDCDSLALEPITSFVKSYLPFFRKYPHSFLELRTKSTNINFLLKERPLQNCIVAFTLSPEKIVNEYEKRTPSLKQRVKALQKLVEKNWTIGFRFDPIIYCDHFFDTYRDFFHFIFDHIPLSTLHSVTLGPFRLPPHIYKKMRNLYPKEKLFYHHIEEKKGLVSYSKRLEEKMISFCKEQILQYIPEEKLYSFQL